MGKKAEFTQWMGAVLDALRNLGGSGSPKDVIQEIVHSHNIPDEKLSEKTKTGIPRIKNQIYWARQYLVWEGFLDSTKKGIWTLSETGLQKTLTVTEAHAIFLKWVAIHTKRRKNLKTNSEDTPHPENLVDENSIDENSSIAPDYRQELIAILRSLEPSDFEKFCLLLLRENGFEELQLTGGSKDEGIDGYGLLRINPFVSFKILFQCKRYSVDNKISRSQIADFRNAMLGRADKGIFITTSFFSRDAVTEANRDGAPPVELVDSEQLIDMIELSELGLKPVKTYEVDYEFFKQYKA